jgi:hypothetical protein
MLNLLLSETVVGMHTFEIDLDEEDSYKVKTSQKLYISFFDAKMLLISTQTRDFPSA